MSVPPMPPPPSADDFAVLAPRYSGGASALASSTVVYLIFKSQTKLRTIYHRLMLGMSTADILSSIAMGLTTLPMDRKYNFYPWDWAGTRLGNAYTCNAQGFFYSFGLGTLFWYIGSLVLYYTLAIAFKMKEEKICKYWEPFLHAVPIFLGLIPPISSLVTFGNIKPTGYAESWCTANSGPSTKFFMIVTIVLLLSLILLGFTFIICRTAKMERELKNALRRRELRYHTDYYERHPQMQRVGNLRSASAQQNSIKSMQNTRVIFVQALAYVMSFLITLSMPIVFQIFSIVAYRNFEELSESQLDKLSESRIIIVRMMFTLLPLQGLFNALIFVYHKIYNYRRIHPDASRCHVLMLVFSGKADDHVLFSRISMVSVNGEESIDINIHNERNEDNHIHIPMNTRQEGDSDGFDEEAFADENSRNDLSGFSSLPSMGLSFNKIDEDSNVTNGNLEGGRDSVVSWFSRSGNEKVPAGSPRIGAPSSGVLP